MTVRHHNPPLRFECQPPQYLGLVTAAPARQPAARPRPPTPQQAKRARDIAERVAAAARWDATEAWRDQIFGATPGRAR